MTLAYQSDFIGLCVRLGVLRLQGRKDDLLRMQAYREPYGLAD